MGDHIDQGEPIEPSLEAESTGLATEGSPNNVKVVYPVLRELNPNAKPFRFRTVKDELRYRLLGRGEESSANPPGPGSLAGATSVVNGEGAQEEIGAIGGSLPRTSSNSRINHNDSSEEEYFFGKLGRSKGLPYYLPLGEPPTPYVWTPYSTHRIFQQPAPGNYVSARPQEDSVNNMPGAPWSGGFDNRHLHSLSSTEMLQRINSKLEEHSYFQSRCARYMFYLNQKLNEVSTRLDVVDERRGDVNSSVGAEFREPELLNYWKNFGSAGSKAYYGRQPPDNEFWQGETGFNATMSAAPTQESYAVGTETLMNNNLMLNNKVPPGSRANNFYDNFRSYTQQNMLSIPKNIPPGGLGSSAAAATNWYPPSAESRQREVSTTSSGNTLRNSGNQRNSFARTEFVENIGTKLRNQENEAQPRPPPQQETARARKNDTAGTSGIGRSSRRRESAGTSVFEAGVEGDETARSIIDVISVFLENNGDYPDFIFSLFEKLGNIRSDSDRNRVLSMFSQLIPNSPSAAAPVKGTRMSIPSVADPLISHELQGQAASLNYNEQSSSSRQSSASNTSRRSNQATKQTELEGRQNIRPGQGLFGDKSSGTASASGQSLQRSVTESMVPLGPNQDEPMLQKSCWAPTLGADDGWANCRKESSMELNNKDSWFLKSGTNETAAAASSPAAAAAPPLEYGPPVIDSDSNED